ncbi:uncharacterized protein [Amphiura filiformis]|uniref:uncharacterized protein n=1 Tax=Amphiura filiformis TaxID=82378 RepID=UPI003B21CFF7
MESKDDHQESTSEHCSDLGDHTGSSFHPLGVQDMTCKVDGPKNTEEEMSIESLIKDIGDDLKATCLQWLQPMTENEKFEKLSPSQVDELLEQARALELHLQQEKQKLLKSLQVLSRTLQISQ